jgi:hypothetical protein
MHGAPAGIPIEKINDLPGGAESPGDRSREGNREQTQKEHYRGAVGMSSAKKRDGKCDCECSGGCEQRRTPAGKPGD